MTTKKLTTKTAKTAKTAKIAKAKEAASLQAEKMQALLTGACFGKPCFGAGSKCLTCIALEKCAAEKEKAVIESTKKTVRSATKKKSAKNSVTLSDLFALAIIQGGGLKQYGAMRATIRCTSSKKSTLRSYFAHMEDVLNTKRTGTKESFYKLGMMPIEKEDQLIACPLNHKVEYMLYQGK